MRKSEEIKVLGIITLTLALLLAFCLSASDVLALVLLGLIGVLLAMAYARYIKRERVGPADERSERISMIATRNGFLAVIMLLAFDAIASRLYTSLASIEDVSIIAWGLGVFAYIATYLIGIREG